jgi:hypothetical protein
MAQTIDTASNQPIQPVTIVGASNSSGNVNVDIAQSDAIVPIDVQNHLTQTVVAINAVALTIAGGATPNTTSAAITCDGFNEISVVQTSSVLNSGRFQILWSYDNTNFNAYELCQGDKIINSGSYTTRVATVPVRAPYCKIFVENQDTTATPTVTAWAYLKA